MILDEPTESGVRNFTLPKELATGQAMQVRCPRGEAT
jgi:hypothetical protein